MHVVAVGQRERDAVAVREEHEPPEDRAVLDRLVAVRDLVQLERRARVVAGRVGAVRVPVQTARLVAARGEVERARRRVRHRAVVRVVVVGPLARARAARRARPRSARSAAPRPPTALRARAAAPARAAYIARHAAPVATAASAAARRLARARAAWRPRVASLAPFSSRSTSARGARPLPHAGPVPLDSQSCVGRSSSFPRAAMADSETEMTLCQIQLCHVFKIPPRKSASGHLAKEWTEDVWQGRLRVIQKGRTCTIFLVDKDSGELFAKCPVKEGAVERAGRLEPVLRAQDRERGREERLCVRRESARARAPPPPPPRHRARGALPFGAPRARGAARAPFHVIRARRALRIRADLSRARSRAPPAQTSASPSTSATRRSTSTSRCRSSRRTRRARSRRPRPRRRCPSAT